MKILGIREDEKLIQRHMAPQGPESVFNLSFPDTEVGTFTTLPQWTDRFNLWQTKY